MYISLSQYEFLVNNLIRKLLSDKVHQGWVAMTGDGQGRPGMVKVGRGWKLGKWKACQVERDGFSLVRRRKHSVQSIETFEIPEGNKFVFD
jgi:hypothetical protein